MPEMQPDRSAIQCNYAVGTKACPEGARAYLRFTNPGGDNDRIQILARSRGGRWIETWEDIRRLRDFRVKTIPPEHPLYGRLDTVVGDLERIAAVLNDAREQHAVQRSEAAICGHCHRPAAGYANANGIRLCHTGTVPMEDEPTDCYRLVIVSGHAADGSCCQPASDATP